MNTRSLSRCLLVLAVGSSVACGSSDEGSASGSNGGGTTSGQGASAPNGGGEGPRGGAQSNGGAQNAGAAQNNGGTQNGGGTENAGGAQNAGGTQNAGGAQNAGGTQNTGGHDPGGVGGGMGMGGSASMPAPESFPLLVATSSKKVQVWEHADALKSDDPPSFTLTVPLGSNDAVFGVVATRERLGIVASPGLFLFDDLSKLSATSKPSVTIPAKVLSGDIQGNFQQQVIDAAGDLWLTYGPGRIALFKGFNSLTAASKPQAEFTHQWEQIASAAYYAPDDILFAPQVSGAGLLYYSKAKTKAGVIAAPDGAFDKFNGWQSAVLGNSLFAAGESLGVWHGLDTATTPRAPNATLSTSGLYVDASADALVIANSDGTLSYFASASSIAVGTKPQTLTVKPFIYGLDLSNDGSQLATASNTQISVVTHSAEGLKLRAALPLAAGSGQGNDVTFVE